MSAGKCPKCDRPIEKIKINQVSGVNGGKSYRCVTYVCPNCDTILSAAPDPFAMVEELKQQLSR